MRRHIGFLMIYCLTGTLLLGWSPAPSVAAPLGNRVRAKVTALLDKLPEEYRAKMATFAEKVENYVNGREWVEEDYVAPFTVGLQFFLEYSPSSIEDRYSCSILASGPDIQFFDKRAIFPFQEDDIIEESATYVPINALIDFYVYLVIGNELDKYGAFEGTRYFERARSVLQEAKFSRFVKGWDFREDTLDEIFSENYKKFREMKDYYFYGMSILHEEPAQARDYIVQAIQRLEKVLKENDDNQAAKQFIDAHYQTVIEIFKKSKNTKPIEILMRLDPERKEIYEECLRAN